MPANFEGWQTTGLNQSPGMGTDYPLTAPSVDVKYLLGDLFLAYEDENCNFVLPFQITHLINFNNGTDGPRRDMVIKDANGTLVFDSTMASAYTDSGWGDHLRTLSWSYPAGGALRCTFHTHAPKFSPSTTWAASIVPANGFLDGKTLLRMPRRVKSFQVGLQKFDSGNLVWTQGYNVQLVKKDPVQVDGGRRKHEVHMRAKPGDGIGRVPGCEDTDLAILHINNISPTPGGDFIIDAAGCYWLRRPAVVVSESPREVQLDLAGVPVPAGLPYPLDSIAALSSLQINNDCQPCCSCQDYLSTYEGVRRVRNEYASLFTGTAAAITTYNDNIKRWNRQRDCRLMQPLKLIINAEPGGKLYVAGAHCNLTQCCARPLWMRTTFQMFDGHGGLIPVCAVLDAICTESKRIGSDTNYQEVPYSPIVNCPVMDHVFDYEDTQASSRFRNRVLLPVSDDGSSSTVVVTLSVHSPDIFSTVDGHQCPLPDPASVPVSDSVLAIWDMLPPKYPVRAVISKRTAITICAGKCT